MDLDPHLRGIDPDPQRALKWQPVVLVLLGLGFGLGALLGSAGAGLAMGAGLTGVFIAWREVLSERRQEELNDRRAEELVQRRDQMRLDSSELTPFERIGRARAAPDDVLNSGSSRSERSEAPGRELTTASERSACVERPVAYTERRSAKTRSGKTGWPSS